MIKCHEHKNRQLCFIWQLKKHSYDLFLRLPLISFKCPKDQIAGAYIVVLKHTMRMYLCWYVDVNISSTIMKLVNIYCFFYSHTNIVTMEYFIFVSNNQESDIWYVGKKRNQINHTNLIFPIRNITWIESKWTYNVKLWAIQKSIDAATNTIIFTRFVFRSECIGASAPEWIQPVTCLYATTNWTRDTVQFFFIFATMI